MFKTRPFRIQMQEVLAYTYTNSIKNATFTNFDKSLQFTKITIALIM